MNMRFSDNRPAAALLQDGLFGPCMRTVSGRLVFYQRPDKSDFDIGDIAHHLSLTCRFGGGVPVAYSVAQHCCHVHDIGDNLSPAMRRALLLHDAAEAYMGDLPAPLKALLSAYQALEDGLLAAIGARYDCASFGGHHVERIDARMLATEDRDLRGLPPCNGAAPYDHLTIEPWDAAAARRAFLRRFEATLEG